MNPEDDIEVAGGNEQGGVEEEAERSRHHPAIYVMGSLGKTPPFSFRGLAADLTKKKREQEERERRRRGERRNMWTSTGQQPLAENPIMDWSYILNKKMPSDVHYAALFPRCAQEGS